MENRIDLLDKIKEVIEKSKSAKAKKVEARKKELQEKQKEEEARLNMEKDQREASLT